MKNYPLLVLSLFVAFGFLASAEEKKPNVILIYTDDYGYTDLGILGIDKHVDTPNMDKLARGTVRLRSAYPHGPG